MSEIIITTSNFKKTVEESALPILVDFWAPWCGPCRMIAPTLEEFAKKHGDRIKVGKVNVDEEEELAYKFNINSIPCLILFKDGKPTKQKVGYMDMKSLEDFLG